MSDWMDHAISENRLNQRSTRDEHLTTAPEEGADTMEETGQISRREHPAGRGPKTPQTPIDTDPCWLSKDELEERVIFLTADLEAAKVEAEMEAVFRTWAVKRIDHLESLRDVLRDRVEARSGDLVLTEPEQARSTRLALAESVIAEALDGCKTSSIGRSEEFDAGFSACQRSIADILSRTWATA